MRFSSYAICWLAAAMSLKVSATFPDRLVHEPGRRTEKSPSRIFWRAPRTMASSVEPGAASGIVTPFPLPLRPSPAVVCALVASGARVLFIVVLLDDEVGTAKTGPAGTRKSHRERLNRR